VRSDEQGSRRSISDLQRFAQRRRLSQRDAKVAQPRARSRHDGALRRHGRVSSPPAASLTEMRQAPAPEEQGEFVADLDRIETQRSALPPSTAARGRRPRKCQIGGRWYTAEAWRGETQSRLPQLSTGASNRNENRCFSYLKRGSGGATRFTGMWRGWIAR
jgi:hypothetical protein